MKKIFYLIFSFFLIIFTPKQVLAVANTSLSFSPASSSKIIGETAIINLNINSGSNKIEAVDFYLSFDKDVLEVTSVSMGGFFTGGNELAKNINNASGTVSYSVGIPLSGTLAFYQGTGTALVLSVKAKTAGTGNINVLSNTDIVAQGEAGNVLTNAPSASVVVSASGGGTVDPTPTVTTAPVATATPAPNGDVAATPTVAANTGFGGTTKGGLPAVLPTAGPADWLTNLFAGISVAGAGVFLIFFLL